MGFAANMRLLKRFGVPFVKTEFCREARKLRGIFGKLKKPLVLKPYSSAGIHKTELGLVFTGIDSIRRLLFAYKKAKRVLKKSGVAFEGVLIQEQASGLEVVCGLKMDPVFGKVVMFGLGGIFVEVYGEVVFRAAPISVSDARSMVKKTKAWKILVGARGKKYNYNNLFEIISSISKMDMLGFDEVDFNPVIVGEKKVLCVDIRMK